MVNQIFKHPTSSKLVANKLYCLLSHIELSDDSMERIKVHILPKLVHLKEGKKLLSSGKFPQENLFTIKRSNSNRFVLSCFRVLFGFTISK